MESRPFGAAGVRLSPLAFGCMRLDPARLDAAGAGRLFCALHDRGITTFHSSAEYETFGHFADALRAFRAMRPGAEVQHVVKVAAPHFDEAAFSPARFREQVDFYLERLGAERLDVVQWLVRQTPNTLERRSAALHGSLAALAEVWDRLRAEGKVGALASFPYDPGFAAEVLGTPCCDGLATYLNPAELEYVPFLDAAGAGRPGFVAIRPLAAGLLTPEGLRRPYDDADREAQRQRVLRGLDELGLDREGVAAHAVRFCLMHPGVAAAVVSVSSEAHAVQLADAAEAAEVDVEGFRRAVEAFGGVS
jgi:aryl-alcohol dehydrogenase-like predicted oxidoreductase